VPFGNLNTGGKAWLGAQVESAYLEAMRFLFRKKPEPVPAFTSSLAPAAPVCVIGDVHGASAGLERLFQQLEVEAPAHLLVCVGDYVDRGDDSAGVIEILRRRQAAAPERLVCLMGNHERMMLDFLDAPEQAGAQWLRYGGQQTLASFGLSAPAREPSAAQWRDLAEDLRLSLGAAAETWLRALPLILQSGNVAVVHAAADPALPLEAQSERTLLWGHPDFLRRPRADTTWVVHGHTIVPAPLVEAGRIAIDTGAFATGCLTAAVIETDAVRFVTV